MDRIILIIGVVILLFLVIFQNYKLRQRDKKISELNMWHKIALTDNLTQIPNRAAYSRHIETLGNRKNVAIILFDIDSFKQINDTYGHLTGDKILKSCAQMLSDVFLPPKCRVYRIGGDEFAVITEDICERDVIHLLLEVRKREEGDIGFRLSKGYAMSDGRKSFSHIFKRADEMLYADKGSISAR